MELTIGNYRIRKDDDLNYIVEKLVKIKKTKLSKNDGQQTYKPYGYYRVISQAIMECVDKTLIESESSHVKELLQELKRVEHNIIVELRRIGEK